MADDRQSQTTFPAGLLGGIAVGIVVGIVALIVVGTEAGAAILALVVICGGVALGYRALASQGSESEPEGGLPKLPADAGRPLGDTQQAHDEINPHDFPTDSPARKPAEAEAAGDEGTTRGDEAGGAQGQGGPEEGDRDRVGPEEGRGATTTGG